MLVPGEDRRAGFKPGLPQHSPACSRISTALRASTAVPCHRLANSYLPLKAGPSVTSPGGSSPSHSPRKPLQALTAKRHHHPLLLCLGQHPSPQKTSWAILSRLTSSPLTPLGWGPRKPEERGAREPMAPASTVTPEALRWDLPPQPSSPYLPGPPLRPAEGWPHCLACAPTTDLS